MRLLDLFCGAGGAAAGYHRAGFDEIVGVDIQPQPRYPFTFVAGHALDYVAAHGRDFDAIHASPPCQAFSPLRAVHRKDYPELVHATRAAMIATGRPWIIENVVGAPLGSGVVLCGTMFDLRVYRHRRFETSWLIFQPHHPPHLIRAGGHNQQRQRKANYLAGGIATVTGHAGSYCGPAMGIDWMDGDTLSQAIPPAYTQFIGHQLLQLGR
jgi:DNA (cytosine-5)-methyltransferase 1